MLTDEQLYTLETTFDRIYLLTAAIRPRSRWAPALPPGAPEETPAYQVVFRKPTPGEYDQFRANAHHEQRKAKASELLCRATVVAVSRKGAAPVAHDGQLRGPAEKAVKEEFDRLLLDYPAIPEAASNGVGELAGIARDEQEK